jgi:hypothetical protein
MMAKMSNLDIGSVITLEIFLDLMLQYTVNNY